LGYIRKLCPKCESINAISLSIREVSFMEDFNQLKRKLDDMNVPELYEYVKEKYPENEELALGSKKIVIRKILNFERNLLNEMDENVQ
jgi:hypothetical protein